MLLELTLPPNKSPTIQPYDRDTETAVGYAISGTAVPGRPTLYYFDISGLADGDYVMDVANPVGRFLVRISDTNYYIASEWWEIEQITAPVIVQQNLDKSGYTLEDSFTEQIILAINDAIKIYIRGLNIEVKPETKVLGPCKQPIIKMPKKC